MDIKRANVFSSFILKIIAIATMVIDHVGVFMNSYSISQEIAYVFRVIGRLSLPLFCFLIVEGVINTKSFSRYVLRLGIIGSLILITQIITKYGFSFDIFQGNIFIDLILGAIAVKALLNKNKLIKLITLIPVAIGIVSLIFYMLDNNNVISTYFPYYLRPQYHIYSIGLIILFFLSYPLGDFSLKQMGLDPDLYRGTNIQRLMVNSLSTGFLIVFTILYWILGYALIANEAGAYVFWDYGLQNYAMISGALILLYSGLRGYNAKWFQYGTYLFYPLHLVLLFLIFFLIFH